MSPATDRLVRNLPNTITVLRGLAIPVIGWLLAEQRYLAAFWTLAGSAVSDLADGQIARRWNVRTRFGAIADPLADKLTMLTVVVVLAWQGLLPVWLAATIVARDGVIVAGAAAYYRYVGPFEANPTWLSKVNTALEFIVLAAVIAAAAQLINLDAVLPLLYAVVGATVVGSGTQYVVVWSRKARDARLRPRAT